MLSSLHEVLVEMFRERPVLAAEFLTGLFGVVVPEFQRARVSSGDLTDVVPTEYRADAVVVLADEADKPVLAVVVEVQLSEVRRKRYTWPAYVATTRARLECPVRLLVVCPTPEVAAWCAKPITEGDVVLFPRVVGPKRVPEVTDPVLARQQPELAVLSALAHGEQSGEKGVFEALLAALDAIDDDHADLYADMVLNVLPQAARSSLEAFMTTAHLSHRYQSDFARRYYAKGEAEGEARGRAEGEATGRAEGEATAVLAVLDARGIEVPDQVRDDITGCTDLDQLDAWIRRAVTANTVDDLFD